MDRIFHSPVVWFAIGFVLFLLEFIVPGLILFFFAIGAWIVAFVTLFVNLSINTQLIIFLGSSLLSILFLRRWLKNTIWFNPPSKEILEDELMGKTAIAQNNFGPGKIGRVDFKGAHWDASSEDDIQEGERVTIVGNDSIILIVKSNKTTP